MKCVTIHPVKSGDECHVCHGALPLDLWHVSSPFLFSAENDRRGIDTSSHEPSSHEGELPNENETNGEQLYENVAFGSPDLHKEGRDLDNERDDENQNDHNTKAAADDSSKHDNSYDSNNSFDSEESNADHENNTKDRDVETSNAAEENVTESTIENENDVDENDTDLTANDTEGTERGNDDVANNGNQSNFYRSFVVSVELINEESDSEVSRKTDSIFDEENPVKESNSDRNEIQESTTEESMNDDSDTDSGRRKQKDESDFQEEDDLEESQDPQSDREEKQRHDRSMGKTPQMPVQVLQTVRQVHDNFVAYSARFFGGGEEAHLCAPNSNSNSNVDHLRILPTLRTLRSNDPVMSHSNVLK